MRAAVTASPSGPATAPLQPGVLSHFTAGAPRLPPGAGALVRGVSLVICTRRRPDSLARCLDGLAASGDRPDALLVVDASADCETEALVRRRRDLAALAGRVEYVRVTRPLAGLTRQRNFALGRIDTDAVAFVDDDVVLGAGCLGAMEGALRQDDATVGVGAVDAGESGAPGRLLRLRRALGIVDSLRPGHYCRSGMSVSWHGLDRRAPIVEVEWLPGYAMLWRTAVAREVRFDDRLSGYANGEDLDFGLRMASRGRLVIATRAVLRHAHVDGGRPDAFRLGVMTVENAWAIHRRCLPSRTRRDSLWFLWAFTADTLIQAPAIGRPPGPAWRLAHARGRLTGLLRLLLDGAAGRS
jgi:GT2 family glycosyltransferase